MQVASWLSDVSVPICEEVREAVLAREGRSVAPLTPVKNF